MSLVFDVTTDLPKLADLRTVRGLTAEEAASLAEELTAYHQHFAPFFYRLEQRKWAGVYLRGLLTADVPRKNVEAMALRLLGVGPHAEREVRALLAAAGEHPRASLSLVTLATEPVGDIPTEIQVHHAALWLLTQRPSVSSPASGDRRL